MTLAILVPPDQAQHHAEAGLGEEAPVLRVRNLPCFSQDGFGDVSLLEEGDGALAGDDVEGVGIREAEEVGVCGLFLRGEVEDGDV